MDPPASLDTAYNTQSMLEANPNVTHHAVDPETIEPVVHLWNGTHWLLPQQEVDKEERTVTAFMAHVPSVQVALFFSYPQQYGVFHFDDTHLCGWFGQNSISVTVRRSFGFVGTATVNWSAEPLAGFGVSASQTGTLSFVESQQTAVLQLNVSDVTGFSSATVQVRLVSVSQPALIDTERYFTIVILASTNHPFGVVEFTEIEPSITTPEVVTTFRYSVERRCSRADVALSTIAFKTEVWDLEGNEVTGQISLLRPEWQIFDGGKQTIEFTIVDDNVPELNASYVVGLTYARPTDAAVGYNSKIRVDVTENDDARGVVEFVSDETTVIESDGGVVSVPVVRRRGMYGDIEVIWRGVDGTAISGDDFSLLDGFSLNYPEGGNLTYIQVGIVNDTIPEEIEEFTLELVEARDGSRLGNITTHRIRIIPINDNAPVFAVKTTSVVIQEADVIKSNYVIYRVLASDADPGLNGLLRYNISGGNCSFLEVDSLSGDVFFPQPILAVVQRRYCLVVVEATDSAYAPLSDTMEIHVTVNYSYSCPPGEFSNTSFLPCDDCPLDTYQPLFGARNCMPCPTDYFTENAGTVMPNECRGNSTLRTP